MTARERLGPEERSRFNVQYIRANAAAKDLAERHEELSLIPIGQPDAVPKKQWRKKKNHGKANAPGLTAAQSSDKDRLEADRLARGKARAVTPELEMERVPATPPQRKRTNTLVERTPGKPPTPARAAPALPQSPEQSSIPPSTAPARLYKGKGGRERTRTTKGAESKALGLLAESQPRE
jgi:hypothetical protein